MKLTVDYSAPVLDITVKPPNVNISAEMAVVKEYVDAPAYEGVYEVTPSAETQTLDTAGKRLTQPVTINPIPSNYGLITWNGSFLTVS